MRGSREGRGRRWEERSLEPWAELALQVLVAALKIASKYLKPAQSSFSNSQLSFDKNVCIINVLFYGGGNHDHDFIFSDNNSLMLQFWTLSRANEESSGSD